MGKPPSGKRPAKKTTSRRKQPFKGAVGLSEERRITSSFRDPVGWAISGKMREIEGQIKIEEERDIPPTLSWGEQAPEERLPTPRRDLAELRMDLDRHQNAFVALVGRKMTKKEYLKWAKRLSVKLRREKR